LGRIILGRPGRSDRVTRVIHDITSPPQQSGDILIEHITPSITLTSWVTTGIRTLMWIIVDNQPDSVGALGQVLGVKK
jgi:hypothetical protein